MHKRLLRDEGYDLHNQDKRFQGGLMRVLASARPLSDQLVPMPAIASLCRTLGANLSGLCPGLPGSLDAAASPGQSHPDRL